ncbi:hypothetical protein M427DRAFT_27733 [Gonapodya prolifera JEL478]|uniref:Uncharacterized protein n=1 Tax=Gonapodya prolifera (strain JEL478) TaxID=1344416 RepID=A0A139AY05_GONPJ|nr:hypothetical protein M427DRAFT_27733 [Gonapodya prolifera JEL478]|eukprot:KXS21335.1 hypothetical protein M427DRAFT_27733 [Gonapodya prolifera JEL478]
MANAMVLHLPQLAFKMEPFQCVPGQTLVENYAELMDALVNLNPLAHAGGNARSITQKLKQVLDAYRKKNINALQKSVDNEEYTQLDNIQDTWQNEITRKQNMEMQIHTATHENALRCLSDKIVIQTRTGSGYSKGLLELERMPLAEKQQTVAKDACNTLRDIKDLMVKENKRLDPVINTLA